LEINELRKLSSDDLKKKIKDVHFKDPNMKDLKFEVINKYNRIQELKYKIADLKETLEILEDNWDEIKDLFTLEFEE